jgi:hypothetical protein
MFQEWKEEGSVKVKKYRKKPVVIEAVQYFDNAIGSADPFWEWMTADCEFSDPDGVVYDLRIKTLESGEGKFHEVSNGDFIVKGVNGEFYPCKPDIFEKTNEAIE